MAGQAFEGEGNRDNNINSWEDERGRNCFGAAGGKITARGLCNYLLFFYYYVLCLRGDISTASASGAAVFLSLSLAPAFFLPNEIPV